MSIRTPRIVLSIIGLTTLVSNFGCAHSGDVTSLIMQEQRTIQVRDPADLPKAVIPESNPPPTVSRPYTPDSVTAEWKISLDDAIRTALENSEVIRILTGVSAASSGAK